MKMAFGNGIGFTGEESLNAETLFSQSYGSIVAELTEEVSFGVKIGETTAEPVIAVCGQRIPLAELTKVWESTLEEVYPTRAKAEEEQAPVLSCTTRPASAPATKVARPKAVIPVFPGTNCEYDTANACLRAGIEPEILVIRNLNVEQLLSSGRDLEKAIRDAQMIVLPGGFSGGDEPEGSGKFIASFFRNPRIKDAVHDLLKNRDGLMLGICNGFQALIKLGLVPYGRITEIGRDDPTLTFNTLGRHVSRMVYTRVTSVKSPWLHECEVGEMHTVPVSHGEGRFVANDEMLGKLIANGQVATQYVDPNGNPSSDIEWNPNGSVCAIEGITSPDGRVFGKMGHSERMGKDLYKNVPGVKDQKIFLSGVKYFK